LERRKTDKQKNRTFCPERAAMRIAAARTACCVARDAEHDAVMRIGGEAPGGGAILSVGIRASSNHGFPVLGSQFGSALKSQRERRIAQW
jgi:hypothetical protein